MPAPRGRFLLSVLCGACLLAFQAPPAGAHGGRFRPPRKEEPPPPPRDPPPPDPAPEPEKPPPKKPDPPKIGPSPVPTPPDTGGGTPTGPEGGAPRLPPGTPDPRPQRSGRSSRGASLEEWTSWWFYSRDRWLVRPAPRAVSGAASLGASAGARDLPAGDAGEAHERAWRDRALEALRKSFPDDDIEIFTGAAVALGKGGDSRDAAPLLRALERRYADAAARESVVLGLGLLGRDVPGARAALTAVLRDPTDSPRLRGMAAVALGLSGDPAAAPALLSVVSEKGPRRDPASGALVGLGLLRESLVVPDLVDVLDDESGADARALRPYAAYALGRIGGAEAVRALGRALSDSDVQVRRAAVLALGECEPAACEALAPILAHVAREDRDRPCRNFAMLTLGRIGGAAASDALSRCFSLGDRGERNFAALGLGFFGRALQGKDEGTRSRLAFLLRNEFVNREDADYRGALATALGLLRDPEAAAPIRAVLKDRGDPELRAHCALALGLLGATEAAADLRAVLSEKGNPALQREAALALGLLGDPAAAKVLAALVGGASAEHVRSSAAAALGTLGGEEASRALEGLLQDRGASGAARGQAAVGIGLLVDPRPGGALSTVSSGLNYLAPTPVLLELLTIP